jgi:predicted aminopeptidase
VAAQRRIQEDVSMRQENETHNSSRVDLDGLAAALAERLNASGGSPWMNTAEAAEYMRVSVRWLRQHLRQVPHSKVEGRLFFSRRELDAWLAGHRRS